VRTIDEVAQQVSNLRRFVRSKIEGSRWQSLAHRRKHRAYAIFHGYHLVAIPSCANQGHGKAVFDQPEQLGQDAQAAGPGDQPRTEDRRFEPFSPAGNEQLLGAQLTSAIWAKRLSPMVGSKRDSLGPAVDHVR
jgi:hypothetical protein